MSEAALIARLSRRIEDLEAQVAIRAVVADYMRLCDRLDASTPMEQLADLFTEDAVWRGVGARYAAAFGEHRGRAAIIAMLDGYRQPPHFAFNAHFLTSEKITVSGESASGSWLMLQTATYAHGASDLRSARLTIGFARAGDRWRMNRFETENLFSRPVGRWNDIAPDPVPRT
jgi:ketosteroid isomerase-like protein